MILQGLQTLAAVANRQEGGQDFAHGVAHMLAAMGSRRELEHSLLERRN